MTITDIVTENMEPFVAYIPPQFRFFQGREDCRCVGAIDEKGFAAGAMVAFFHAGWEILWLYVAQACRGKGFAAAMLDGFLKAYARAGAGNGKVSAVVPDYYGHEALSFFMRNGFKAKTQAGWKLFSSPLSSLDERLFGVRDLGGIRKWESLSDSEIRDLERELARAGVRKMGSPPIVRGAYSRFSRVRYSKTGVSGACLARDHGGMAEISLLYAAERGGMGALALAASAVREMRETLPSESLVTALAATDSAARLCREMAKGAAEHGVSEWVLRGAG